MSKIILDASTLSSDNKKFFKELCVKINNISTFKTKKDETKIQKINESSITQDDISNYKNKISKLDGYAFTASDVNIDKRIITIRLGNVDDELTLVNPKITKNILAFKMC